MDNAQLRLTSPNYTQQEAKDKLASLFQIEYRLQGQEEHLY